MDARVFDETVQLIRSSPATYMAVARACGISKSAVLMWTRVPLPRVMAVSRALGIPCHKIRPDAFPPPDEPAAAKAAPNQ